MLICERGVWWEQDGETNRHGSEVLLLHEELQKVVRGSRAGRIKHSEA